ncbi:SAM-dependent methyltransferase [Pseudoalteromonas mariniglutinosa]|uniref:SAM-dependent methyltransferase n=1 Tax=Pseudoalteromonas mariniglutinosa TaxID=206042 RepID=UPI00384A88D9
MYHTFSPIMPLTEEKVATNNFKNFPTRGEHARRWHKLAREIADRASQISEYPTTLPTQEEQGHLTILGSGIEAVAFTQADIALIAQADYVFYCVADPATVVWLKTMRPDAYDLYVFYDDNKVRFITYMQMTEAMLHYVREGKNVVAIYYGHPGIFVLSTHRAIKIARREGHHATMRPGISALDTLTADLGVDPSQPGLLTYEATDMLVRQRKPDKGLHVVLWQVGLIGELGYRRQGYLNSGFTILLDYLEQIYGPEQEVINYVGSRYPGMEPLIDKQTIASLRLPENQERVTGISTFYIPPVEICHSDPEMLKALGLLKPGQSVKTPISPLRQIDNYGAREMVAFKDLAQFEVPLGYHWQDDTPAARFILALCQNTKLRTAYQKDPKYVIEHYQDLPLSERDKKMLQARDPGLAQLAAKNIRTEVTQDNAKLLQDLLSRIGPARRLYHAVERAPLEEKSHALQHWCKEQGYDVDWQHLWEDFQLYLRTTPFAWSGCYKQHKTEQRQVLLLGRVNSHKIRLWVDGQEINQVQFNKGTISWNDQANDTIGMLKTDLTPKGQRRLDGMIWQSHHIPTSKQRVQLIEIQQPIIAIPSLAGCYKTVRGDEVNVLLDRDKGHYDVFLNGEKFKQLVVGTRGGMRLNELNITATDRIWLEKNEQCFFGRYNVRRCASAERTQHIIEFNQHGLKIDNYEVCDFSVLQNVLSWRNGPQHMVNGELTLLIDPITLCAIAHGQLTDNTPLVAMVVATEQQIVQRQNNPDYAIDKKSWQMLVNIAAKEAQYGGLFIWHSWAKACSNLQLTRKALWGAQ